MAQTNVDPAVNYRPEMDGKAHEKTYDAFMHFSTVGTVFVLAIVVALAVGGTKGAWLSAIFGVFLAHVAVGIGLASTSISWRAPAVVLGLMLVMLVLY